MTSGSRAPWTAEACRFSLASLLAKTCECRGSLRWNIRAEHPLLARFGFPNHSIRNDCISHVSGCKVDTREAGFSRLKPGIPYAPRDGMCDATAVASSHNEKEPIP